MSLFLYVVGNNRRYQPANNESSSEGLAEVMAKKRSRGHPTIGDESEMTYESYGIIRYNTVTPMIENLARMLAIKYFCLSSNRKNQLLIYFNQKIKAQKKR